MPDRLLANSLEHKHPELELRLDRQRCEDVDADEGIDENGAAQALAELLDGHRPEALGEIGMLAGCHVEIQGRMSA
jgi:hypothetical protein